jgi:CheY-like chemotaxis protein
MRENSVHSNRTQINNINNKNILFVESSKRIRDALSLFFEFEECNFLAVETPQEALEALRNVNYDIIVADYDLPGLNGLEFLNRIKTSFPDTIEILTTPFADRKLVEDAKEAGIRDVIQKPFSAVALIMHLSQTLESQ